MNHRVDRPVPGWYRRRLVKGGPWVPVLIWQRCPLDPETGEPLDRPPVLLCLVDGEEADALDQWTWVAGNRITRADYDLMTRQAAWDRIYDPDAPAARPREAVDLRTLPPAF